MSILIKQLKWQFVLLQKNNIISISFGVTIIYGLILYLLRHIGSLNEFLIALVLNDPSVIGYFFVGLAIYTEIKHEILSAVLVTPVSIHLLIISKVLALSVIGVICSLGLAISVLGFNFDIFAFIVGSFGICTLSALLGIAMLTYASEFLKFTMLSIPIFLVFINIPLLQYLGVIELGVAKYLFPIQGSLDLINFSVSGTDINHWISYLSTAFFIPIFYALAYRRFNKKLVS
jgi:fluoroquinolone transport system permease protein